MYTEEEAIQHYGVKGMRWGVRRTPEQLARARGKRADKKKKAPPSEDAKSAQELIKKSKKSGPDSLSNDELKKLNERLNLEQNYNRLTNPDKKKKKNKSDGQKFMDEQLSKMAQRKVADFLADGGVLKMIDWGLKISTPFDFSNIKLD